MCPATGPGNVGGPGGYSWYAPVKLKFLQILWHSLILLFQILMNVQSAIRVEMVHAPMLLGVLNAIAMKALSQDP